MVSTMEAVEILKEAKKVESGINQENIGFFKGKIKNLHNELHGKKLGASFYRPVKNTTTGNLMMEHVATVGVPAPNTGWSVSGTSAVATYGVGALGTIALFSAATDFEKAQSGGAEANNTQRNRALGKLAVAVGCFALLAPGNYAYPFKTGSIKPTDSTNNMKMFGSRGLGSFYRIYDEAETRSGPVF